MLTKFGIITRCLRLELDLTLMDMAQALAITPSRLSAIEYGREPLSQALAKQAEAYFRAKGATTQMVGDLILASQHTIESSTMPEPKPTSLIASFLGKLRGTTQRIS